MRCYTHSRPPPLIKRPYIVPGEVGGPRLDPLQTRRPSQMHHSVGSNTTKLEWVKGHSGNLGNDNADKLANEGAIKAQLSQEIDLDAQKNMRRNSQNYPKRAYSIPRDQDRQPPHPPQELGNQHWQDPDLHSRPLRSDANPRNHMEIHNKAQKCKAPRRV